MTSSSTTAVAAPPDELLEAVRRIDARLERLETALEPVTELLEAMPDSLATVANVFDDAMDRAGQDGVALDRLGHDARLLLLGLLRALPQLRELLESGLLDPGTLRSLGLVGRAVAEASDEEPPRVGLFGLLGALRDTHVRRAVGFTLSVASTFGRSLQRSDKRLAPPTGNEA